VLGVIIINSTFAQLFSIIERVDFVVLIQVAILGLVLAFFLGFCQKLSSDVVVD